MYGLPARGIDGKEAADASIEAMAAYCIGTMKQVQPRGPYLLLGFCSGGLVAYEMACQLCSQGESVALLALCDIPPPGVHFRQFARMLWQLLLLKNVGLVQQRLYRFVLQNTGLSRLRKFRTVGEAHFWALFSYRPRPYRDGP